MDSDIREISPIAYMRTGFGDKFGIPRQAGLAPLIKGRIVFEPEYRDTAALRGIEGYSHLWVIFGFNRNRDSGGTFSPTVRPPKLGGNERMGVFATRSPYRPNGLGLSCLEISDMVLSGDEGPVIIVSGVDLADMTPIYDIKPYIPFADSHPDARAGFTQSTYGRSLSVRFCDGVRETLPDDEIISEIESLVANDPRPGYQNDPERVYHIVYKGYETDFRVIDERAEIIHIVQCH